MKQCTIQIRDEVNIKIEGLDLDARKALVNAFKYENPAARYLPAVRLGRWDGKVAYFQLGGSTYVNLLPEIMPILEKFDYDIELDDQRDYSNRFTFESVTETSFEHVKWPRTHPAAGQPIMLRDYQQLSSQSTVHTRSGHRCRQDHYDSSLEQCCHTLWSEHCYCAQQESCDTD